jgi:hypothetical protein
MTMTETDLNIILIILVLALISLIDFIIVTGSVWASSRIFRYNKKDRRTATIVAAYWLKVGLIVASPFVLALYATNPSLGDILAKGARLLLPLGLVFLVKTSATFLEMKKAYGEGMKKTVNGYATAAYLIITSWILVFVVSSMLIGFYGMFPLLAGADGEYYNESFSGWSDLQPDLPGNYTRSSSSYSVLFRNARGEPIRINSALVVDLISEDECNVSYPYFPAQLDVNGTVLLSASCPKLNISEGDAFGMILEMNYTALSDSAASQIEDDVVSGNASA